MDVDESGQTVVAGPVDDLGAGGWLGVVRFHALDAARFDQDERVLDDFFAVPQSSDPNSDDFLREGRGGG
jgi:hypothetical protein